MRLNPNNFIKTATNFKRMKPPTADELRAIGKFVNENIDGFQNSLIESIHNKAPNLIKQVGGIDTIDDFSIFSKILNTIGDVALAPLSLLDGLAKKFPKLGLNNSKILKAYRGHTQLVSKVNALQGLQENTLEVIRKYTKNGENIADFSNEISKEVGIKLDKLLNNQMSYNVADYDTKKERLATRIVSGFTAAVFLGNDFYNKAIQKGKNEQEAKKEQRLKQNQEYKENICEGLLQFGSLALFSKLINKSIWAPAIVSTAIGLISRVVSRKASNMPIRRIKATNNANQLTFNKFQEKIKANQTDELFERQKEDNTPKKKPILSFKNILMFCALSIASGYALKNMKNPFPGITSKIKNLCSEKHPKALDGIIKAKEYLSNKNSKVNLIAEKSNLEKLSEILTNCGEGKLADKIRKIQPNSDGEIVLGEIDATRKIFGIEVSENGLKRLITAPFVFIKEAFFYPYKIVSKLEESVTKAKGAKTNLDIKFENKDITNIYARFLDFKAKYGKNEEQLAEEFSKYVKEMRINSNNLKTSSSTDASKIAVIAQTMGTLTGMWFNMNDEYNSSIRNGATKYEAEKDARLRGINKFFRMSVQIAISGALNTMFFKQYNSSVAKSACVVALSTFLSDKVSRVLSGMPNKKMTKEELEQYQKEHKEGMMSWYYKLIDKLAS